MKTVILFLAAVLLSTPASAQESFALAVEGWRQQEDPDGVVNYRCASSICAAGSKVGYKAQPHRTNLTLADFERHHQRLADEATGTRNVRKATVSDSRERTIEGVRVMQISRVVAWTSGNVTHTIEARLIGPDKSFSLVSDSPQADWTKNNFEGFLRRMVDIAGIRGR